MSEHGATDAELMARVFHEKHSDHSWESAPESEKRNYHKIALGWLEDLPRGHGIYRTADVEALLAFYEAWQAELASPTDGREARLAQEHLFDCSGKIDGELLARVKGERCCTHLSAVVDCVSITTLIYQEPRS